MALTINRAYADINAVDGVSEGEDSLDIQYIIAADNGEDESDVITFVQNPSNIPATYLGLFRQSVSFDRLEETDDYWVATASYVNGSDPSAQPKLDVDEVRWQVVGGSGGTLKRTFSRSLVSETLPTGSTAPAFDTTEAETAVGLVYRDGDFEIEGVDVSVGGTQISVQTVWNYATAITGGRVVTAAGHADNKVVNSAAWNGFAAGTLQLETFSARNRPGTTPLYDIDFTLNFSANLTNIDVGNDITVPAKKGHEVLDVLYTKKQVAGLPIPVPIRAAVHQVFEEINFATVLGL